MLSDDSETGREIIKMAKRRPSSDRDHDRIETEEKNAKEIKRLKSARTGDLFESVSECDANTESDKSMLAVSDTLIQETKSLFSETNTKFNISSTESSLHESENSCSNAVPSEEKADVIVEFDPELPADEANIDNADDGSKAMSLQEAAENMISSKSRLGSQIIETLKKGICYSWIKNNFKCQFNYWGNICTFEHNARRLFRKKLKNQPSSFIVQAIVEMRNDLLFPDALEEGFEILKKRFNSERFLPFLCFFAFYVSDLNDAKHLALWSSAAEHFCSLIPSEDKTDGFAYLLKIFRLIDCTKQSKIIDFIKMLKNPYFNQEITWKLLKPVIILNIPSSLLIEAIESCNKTKANIDEVHTDIASRIPVHSLSIEGVETILRFCRTLEVANRIEEAGALKRRLLTKVQGLEASINKTLHPETDLYHSELKSRGASPSEEENKDLDVLKSDEEKVEKRAFSPPPPHCILNQSYFMEYASLPRKFEGRPRPPHSSLKRSRVKYTDPKIVIPYEQLIKQVSTDIKSYEFTRVGESFNLFQSWRLDDAAKHLVQRILQMKISSNELLDFFKKVIFSCNSRNSAVIIASIANTIMYFFVKCKQIDDLKTAYSILDLCSEKEIDLSQGKVFASNEEETLSKMRIVLLLVEICLNNDKYEKAYYLIEKFNLVSECSFSEPKSADDDLMRVNILKDFLEELVINQSSLLCKTFKKAWKAQGDLQKPIDLAKYANEFLILSINNGDMESLSYYRRLAPSNCLKEITIRAIVVALVQFGRIEEAETSMHSLFQSTYKLPLVNGERTVLTIQSCWTEEEIFVVVNVLFKKLERSFISGDPNSVHLEILLQVVREKDLPKEVKVYPKELIDVDCSFESAKSRIVNVLKNGTFQFLKIEESDNRLIVNSQSLKQHLEYRAQKRADSVS